jgi:hypothetical protein
MSRTRLALAAALLATVPCGLPLAAQESGSKDVLRTLRTEHPRIYLTGPEWTRLKQRVQSDPLAKRWYEQCQKSAARILKEPPVEHVLIGPRLLDKSRRALDRISTLAALYRLDGDRAKLERARKELLTVCAFPDWNPSHFLDTAEMSNAVGIGYDWLYDDLSPADRATIKKALVELGLKEGLKVYRDHRWWAVAVHNWNQVCNGGMTVGALAIADEEPALAAEIVAAGRESIQKAMHTFAPDGGWPEGPGYWGYATMYNVFYLNAIDSALGTDFGLKAFPGFSVTGGHRIEFVGPIGRTFNYADAHDGAGTAAQMLWFARAFQHPEYARHEIARVGDRPSIWHLLYLNALPEKLDAEPQPLDAVYRGIDVAYLRGAWDDPKAFFIGFKGGDNKANHSHLDLGSFVLDALGQRWGLDLGSDEYNLPGYFGKERWTYFRLRTESHNTLTLGTDNQDPKAAAPLLAFHSAPARSLAVADLSAAYRPKVEKSIRGIELLDRSRVVVQDEVEAKEPVELRWNFLTRAKIDAKGDHATLTLGGETLEARILEPTGVEFAVLGANPPEPQAQQPDVHNLAIRLPKGKSARLVVQFAAPGAPRAAVEPLRSWIALGPLKAAKPTASASRTTRPASSKTARRTR